MDSTMQNSPLTVAAILRYAVGVHGDRTVTTATGDGFRHATYSEVGRQAARQLRLVRGRGTLYAARRRRLHAAVLCPLDGRLQRVLLVL